MKFKYLPICAAMSLAMITGCSKDDDETPSVPFVPSNGCFDHIDYTAQLPNMDFDSWGNTSESNGRYEEPCGAVWATGNPGTILFGETTVAKSTESHSGSFSARLETRDALVLASGSLFTGSFTANISNPAKSAKLGVPFTSKPVSMEGYYRYTSVKNDSSQIFLLLTKFNTTTKTRDTVGYGQMTETNTVANFTRFDFPVDYTSYSAGTLTPDSIALVFVSSKLGLEFKGQVGSTLFIDNCKFLY